MKTIKTAVTILSILLMVTVLASFVTAQQVFTTSADNADNSGAHVADGDFGIIICSVESIAPIEFYITQNISPASMLNATLQLTAQNNDDISCNFNQVSEIKVNGNTVGTGIGNICGLHDVFYNVNPAFLIVGDNLINITISTGGCAGIYNANLIIYPTEAPPDSCQDTDGNNISTQGTVSGFLNGNQYSNADICLSNNTVTEYTCNLVTSVATNVSCGSDGFTTSNYCTTGNVYRDYTSFSCASGACGSSTVPQLIQNCGTSGFSGGLFCFNGNVSRNFTTVSCTSGSCGSSTAPVLNTTCQFGCTNAVCNIDPNLDTDNDTIPDVSDNCPTFPNVNQANLDKEIQVNDTIAPFFVGDNLGDACDDDWDNDGFNNTNEVLITTNPRDPCGIDGWPLELNVGSSGFNSTNKINIVDITSFLVPVRHFGTNVGDPNYSPRWDLVPGKGQFTTDINIQDLTALIAGPTAFPPMLGGAKAFNGPECPIAP
ncbi:MAG: thrombospondin type 3 repeat-containing protein [Nanoarchaeota archaeon]